MKIKLSILLLLVFNFCFGQFPPSDLYSYSFSEGVLKKTIFFQKNFGTDNSYQFTITMQGGCSEYLQGTIVKNDEGLHWETEFYVEPALKFTFGGGGTINQPYPMCVVESKNGEDYSLCSFTGTYIGDVYPLVQPNLEGKIGNYAIEMYLGDSFTVGTGRFSIQYGYYYYNSVKQAIYIRANSYMGNLAGQGGGKSISELDYNGEEQAIFEISNVTQSGFSGTWKSTRNNTQYSFYLLKK